MTQLSLAVVIWLVIAIVAAVLEGLTVQLVALWFAFGAVGASIAAALDASPLQQFILFVTLSLALMLATRPFVKKKLHIHKQSTNADALIGQTGLVRDPIDNTRAIGRVLIQGLDWAAVASDGQNIPEGTLVRVLQIEGVKLIVEALPKVPAVEKL